MAESIYPKLFTLMHSALFGVPFSESMTENEWQIMYEELSAQAVLSLPYDIAVQNPTIPSWLKSQWTRHTMSSVTAYYRVLHEQNELLNLLEEHQIPTAVLKGSTVAAYYPAPSYRAVGDIDFLVPASLYAQAISVLKENGYSIIKEEDLEIEYAKHTAFIKDQITIELHGRPFRVESRAGKTIEQYLFSVMDEGLQNKKYVLVDESKIPRLPTVQTCLELLLHMESHLKDGIGLKHIIDWMMFVHHELPDQVFEEVRPVLERAGLTVFAKIVTKISRIYLGLPDTSPNGKRISWYNDVNQGTCEAFMTYVLEQGNFGRKIAKYSEEERKSKGAKVIAQMHNPISFYRFLQEYGLRNWELARRNRFVRPFAWMYQVVKYFRILINGGYKNIMRQTIQKGKKRMKMFDGLELFK